MYILAAAAVGHYMVWQKIAGLLEQQKKADVAKIKAAVNVRPAKPKVVKQPEQQFKVNKKVAEKQLQLIRERRAVDAGMHNLTSKFHRAKV